MQVVEMCVCVCVFIGTCMGMACVRACMGMRYVYEDMYGCVCTHMHMYGPAPGGLRVWPGTLAMCFLS